MPSHVRSVALLSYGSVAQKKLENEERIKKKDNENQRRTKTEWTKNETNVSTKMRHEDLLHETVKMSPPSLGARTASVAGPFQNHCPHLAATRFAFDGDSSRFAAMLALE